MLIVRLMGLADVLAAASLLLLRWNLVKPLAFVCFAYILVKSFRYFKDFASIIDFVAAITLGAALLGYYSLFSYLMVLWLLQKGLRSLL